MNNYINGNVFTKDADLSKLDNFKFTLLHSKWWINEYHLITNYPNNFKTDQIYSSNIILDVNKKLIGISSNIYDKLKEVVKDIDNYYWNEYFWFYVDFNKINTNYFNTDKKLIGSAILSIKLINNKIKIYIYEFNATNISSLNSYFDHNHLINNHLNYNHLNYNKQFYKKLVRIQHLALDNKIHKLLNEQENLFNEQEKLIKASLSSLPSLISI